MELTYKSLEDRLSKRKVRPLQTEYWGRVWTFSAWCELRRDFRVFRIDRIERCEATDTRFLQEEGKTLRDYLRTVAAQMSKTEQNHG